MIRDQISATVFAACILTSHLKRGYPTFNRRDVSQSSTLPACTPLLVEIFGLFDFVPGANKWSILIRPGRNSTQTVGLRQDGQVSLVRKRTVILVPILSQNSHCRRGLRIHPSRLIWICFNYVGAGPSRAILPQTNLHQQVPFIITP